MIDYKQHPLSAVWPAMDDATFAEFRADIEANGLNGPIKLFEGAILDGWHRYQACMQTGVLPRYQNFAGDAAAAMRLVISANAMRRHLDASQRSMVAERLATLAHGGHLPKDKREEANLPLPSSRTIKEAAELLDVSPRYVKDARVVRNSGRPELIEQVERGETPVYRAAREVREARWIDLKITQPPATTETHSLIITHHDGPRDGAPKAPKGSLVDQVRERAFADLARLQKRCENITGLDGVWQAVDDARLADAKRKTKRAAIQDVEDDRFARSLEKGHAWWRTAPEEVRDEFLQDVFQQLTPEKRAAVVSSVVTPPPAGAVLH